EPAEIANTPMDTSAPSLELRIEQLVLEGVAPGDRYRVADALRAELRRLLGAQGAAANFPASVSERRIDAGTIHIGGGAPADHTGKQIARAVYGAIGATTSSGGKSPRS